MELSLGGAVTKLDTELRVAYGWMSVATENGEPVLDKHGHMIAIENLQDVVWKFMDTERVSATMHSRDESGAPIRTGKFVDSIVITKDLATAMGMDSGREGWFVGIKIDDDATWERVKSGELAMFSIGAFGRERDA